MMSDEVIYEVYRQSRLKEQGLDCLDYADVNKKAKKALLDHAIEVIEGMTLDDKLRKDIAYKKLPLVLRAHNSSSFTGDEEAHKEYVNLGYFAISGQIIKLIEQQLLEAFRREYEDKE